MNPADEPQPPASVSPPDVSAPIEPSVPAAQPDRAGGAGSSPTGQLGQCGEIVGRLNTALLRLEQNAALLHPPPLADCEWYRLLRDKLLPQLRDDSFLVVAVVGGTNIGKSVIFNHLAGIRASSTSPLASGTKHPVCLVPPGFAERHDLAAVFPDFTLRPWSDSDDALEADDANLLFWRTSTDSPENLLVLDTPDIDSDARVNWDRADAIRRCADVLIAVLTQQKYNDAAVKQFFRQAAAEDRAVVVVFNQCQLPDDEDYWPLWLRTFCRETGIVPEVVYVAPSDRRAAEENRLTFHERPFSVKPSSEGTTDDTTPPAAETHGSAADERFHGRDLVSLGRELSVGRFDDIKLRTLRGSLEQLVDSEQGAPGWLRDVAQLSGRFESAGEILATEKLAELDRWPTVPTSVLVAEIRQWWQQNRTGWHKPLHGFFNAVGTGLMKPVQFVRNQVSGPPVPPLVEYRQQEWQAVLRAVNRAFERLQMLRELGNPLLQERLQRLLAGTTREDLLRRLESEHQSVDLDGEIRAVVSEQMNRFRQDSPSLYHLLHRVDQLAALGRPAVSVVLFATGFGPAGDAAAQLATETALQSVIHVAGDVAGGTAAATVGEAAVSRTVGEGAGRIEAHFRHMHQLLTARRLDWLLDRLNYHVWGELVAELQRGTAVARGENWQAVQECVEELRSAVTELSPPAVG